MLKSLMKEKTERREGLKKQEEEEIMNEKGSSREIYEFKKVK